MIKIIILLFLALVTPAYAQDDLALCKLRAPHAAAADVAYKPGVDVYGNSVTPADMNSVPEIVPDIVRIPMNIDLAQRLSLIPGGVEMKIETGMIEVHKDGRMTFNSQDLTQKITTLCDEQAVEKAPVEIPMQDKSEESNDIIWGQGY